MISTISPSFGTHGPLGYLSLCEDLGLLTLLQARGEAGHDVLLRTDHLHDLLVTLDTHSLERMTGEECVTKHRSPFGEVT